MMLEDAIVRRFVLDVGLATRADIDACIAGTKATGVCLPLAEALTQAGILTHDDLRRIVAYAHSIPFVALPAVIPTEILTLIPEAIAREHYIIPYARDEDSISIAMLDLDALEAVTAFLRGTALRVRPALTDEQSLRAALARYQAHERRAYGGILEDALQSEQKLPRILDTMLTHALLTHATDIHIEQGPDALRVRYRIEGALREVFTLPPANGAAFVEHIASLAHLTDTTTVAEGRFRVTLQRAGVLVVRVTRTPTHRGVRLVLHITKPGRVGYTLDSLGMSEAARETLLAALQLPHGAVVIAGGEQSGVSTLYYTLLDTLQHTRDSVVSIEASIETELRGIHQIVARPTTGDTVVRLIHAALRSDADVIGVAETAHTSEATLLLSAAGRGHRVVMRAHGTNAVDALETLRTYNLSPNNLREVSAIVACAQVRRLGEEREKHYLTAETLAALRTYAPLTPLLAQLKSAGLVNENATWSSIPFFRPVPDSAEPYTGSVGCYEVLTLTPALMREIESGASETELLAHASTEGMTTLVADALYKAVLGMTTIDEVLALAQRLHG